jgi:hypothetical protein
MSARNFDEFVIPMAEEARQADLRHHLMQRS